ncbi:hypothetical protein [Halomarina litorea]|nr:hypothetical protein [Halomarina sp. BCD28]
MSLSVSVECPRCRRVVSAEPDESVGRRANLRGTEVACDCGHSIDLYYY